MKKLLIIATLAAVGMGACSKDDGVSAPEDLRKYVQVTIPENAASGETRTSVDGTTTSWVAGDRVAVSLYNGSTTEVCEFTADRTGATTTFSGSVPVGSYTCAAAHYPFCAATFDAVNKTFTHTWGDAYCSTDLAAYDFMFSTVYETPFVGDKICNFITYWFTVTYNVYQRAVLNLVSFWYHYITFVIISLNFISYIFLLYF